MQIPRAPHRWSVTPKAAIAIQRRLAERVVQRAHRGRLRTVVGTDMAFTPDGGTCIAAAIVWDIAAGCVVEERLARRAVTFPYVPGLLTFREAPAVLAALRKLRIRPDAMMCDGQGFAHPRRIGLASHLGVVTGLPTVGCAKSLLIGTHGALGVRKGSRTTLLDGAERIGTVLRTRDGVRPVYVSVGHNLSLDQAEELVLACAAGYRIPEPTRLADLVVAVAKRTS
ncbi:MAG TPA: deoxyribonuclease V [Phycisphaerae bacterium]|mgnify:CR=1 FL=1|nr:endonuclease V [Phycisphaerales bacterium]HRX83765.1 deoxyribonuclease V [Phycisphaerae bacterium]